MLKKTAFAGLGVMLAMACAYLYLPSKPSPVYSFNAGQANITEDLFLDWKVLEHLKCQSDDRFCSYFRQVQDEARRHRQFVEETFGQAAGKRVDVILFYHRTMDHTFGRTLEELEADEVRARVLATNALIEGHLLALKPDVIGVESCYGEKCDVESEMDDALKGASILGQRLDREAMSYGMNLLLAESWYLQMGKKYPGLPLMGIDNFEFQMLDQWITMVGTAQGEVNWPAVRLLWRLRSQYALARLISVLKDRQHGVAVMGYAHGRDFKDIMPAIGVIGGIYKAIPKGVQLKEF